MLIGRRLSGRYKILEVIGGGGMANVYLARDVILERDVAIKILRLDFSNDEELIKRFRREAHSATSLAHPNVVSIYDVGEEDNIYYIVMEYVPGKTLKQYIQKYAPLDSKEALDIIEQLTSAIAHAHHNHIVHRDIKPQNILVDNDGTVKVTDFGIAVALSSTTITQTNSVLGSVHYLSPEQARGGMATNKSDIYSLGIVLFELLTGRVPFEGESAVSIALKHLQTETPSPKRWNPSIPQSVENIILKATAKDPFHRYSTVEEMEEDIRTALSPNRLNEERFVTPLDNDEVTKAIPIIKEEPKESETIIRGKTPETPDSDKQKQKEEKRPKKKTKLFVILLTVFLLIGAAGVAAITIIPSLFLPKEVTIPDLNNWEYDEALKELVTLGLEVEDPIQQVHDEIPEGHVIKTDPKANTTVREGSSITIYESTGKEKLEFDNYEGMDISEVEDLLNRLGFESITIERINHDSEPGTIISQSIDEGEMVIPSETDITFEVSDGPPKIVLRNLERWTQELVDDYTLENELNINRDEQYSDEVPKGLVISQSPKPGTELKRKDTIEVVFSLGPEERKPKEQKVEITIPYNPTEEDEEQHVVLNIEDAEHSLSDVYDSFTISKSETITITFLVPYGQNAKYLLLVDGKLIENKVIPYDDSE
ncbi:Stk1 family PASTA domain-containing Ser/Thr kinase [Bacillus sp. PS06]|uniref:Stk1 family PASTA domain-containing Ser/Thr kinase n=1 Tax=Bacillus sp. PS06 TaxID=2764176 RepID=UPI0017800714|nr:Stk1 family PASTA domain-containing Ser/Thr kinase [Bacillus sp. PS06]MBD8068345.1 Stk1 family PASTA domain-containing Ser/Thr kinase [Bacillus sp. PS06]